VDGGRSKDVKASLVAYLRSCNLPDTSELRGAKPGVRTGDAVVRAVPAGTVPGRSCERRRAHRIERLLRQSRIPAEKDLPSFDLKRLPLRWPGKCATLLDGSFLDRREKLLVSSDVAIRNILQTPRKVA